MNKLSLLILILLFVNNCSLNENQSIWKNKDIKSGNKKNIKEFLIKDKISTAEFNPQLKLDLTKINLNNHSVDNKNNYGPFNYQGFLKKIGNYKFSKFSDIDKLDFRPTFLEEGIIFFDKKGSIIKYNQAQKIIWKNNYYSKTEKKLQPKLNFAVSKKILLVTDNIAKYYAININDGELIWSKNNIYPFNSEIKVFEDKFFVIDYKNTLRCYDIFSGLECWNLQTEGSFILSGNKQSLIILNNSVIFSNSIGDITAVDIDTGIILWQLPTQSNNIINEIYSFKNSKLISDGRSIFFSNNKNEFYSIDSENGSLNWVNEINSNITPVIIGDLIFTISNDGYLFVIQKEKGNIIRINDVYKEYNIKKRIDISPIGFVTSLTKLYLINSDGKLIVSELISGNTLSIKKISGGLISQPFIFNENLFIIRNGSIIQYN